MYHIHSLATLIETGVHQLIHVNKIQFNHVIESSGRKHKIQIYIKSYCTHWRSEWGKIRRDVWWCQTGWSEWFRNCWSPLIFMRCLILTQNGIKKQIKMKEKNPLLNASSLDWNSLLISVAREEWPGWFKLTGSSSNYHSIHLRWAEKQLRMHNMPTLGTDVLQQQMLVPLLLAKKRNLRL